MNNIQDLIAAVNQDAYYHQHVVVTLQHNEEDNTLRGSYEDDAGEIYYDVPNASALFREVINEADGNSFTEIVDAFWRVMNDKYKNQ